ncbi:hypothetical protein wVul_0921 [Wolbachia endosymbiont of Armadillidium vulgare str. wVulC]|nr:hypothetical protein wVul_0921 [Wolbachia endosymbiont of Armadillidium vulgare str. wVulC]
MLISVIFFSNNYFPLSILLLLYVNFLFLALRFFVFSHFHFLQQIGLLTLPILYHANHIDLLMVFYIHYISQMCFFDFLLLPKLSLLLTLVHIFLLPYFYPFTFLLGLTIFFWSSLWGALYCLIVTLHAVFHHMKNVDLYDIEDFGTQYLHFRCTLHCPFH